MVKKGDEIKKKLTEKLMLSNINQKEIIDSHV